jgi:erythronate-4-phosphate dehydrogenase
LHAGVKIVADENIPQALEAFSDLGEVTLIPGRNIEPQHLLDCQCLLVRTVTSIDANLLEDTPVEFVGTATIGTDHIDLDYLKNNNIGFSNAAGCNAEAASEYVISGLFALSERHGFDPFSLKAGVIGYGNVGSRVHQKLQALGIDTLLNDPPLEAARTSNQVFVDLETIVSECNFITLHVPLTRTGKHPTYHLFDQSRLYKLKQNCLLVNAARGPVIDNPALLNLIKTRPDLVVFLDTWENEPDISRELLDRVSLATPHIAGYSVEGRLRGTQMILDAACEFFSKTSNWKMSQLLPERLAMEAIDSSGDLEFWQTLFRNHHDIWQDHLALTQARHLDQLDFVRHFESLRRVYEQRFEYERYRLPATSNKKAATIARQLLFH